VNQVFIHFDHSSHPLVQMILEYMHVHSTTRQVQPLKFFH